MLTAIILVWASPLLAAVCVAMASYALPNHVCRPLVDYSVARLYLLASVALSVGTLAWVMYKHGAAFCGG